MEYENYKEVCSIVEQIEKHQGNLDSLVNNPYVVIQTQSGYRIFTIGTEPNCEHEYYKRADNFVFDIRADLQECIVKLKKRLELL